MNKINSSKILLLNNEVCKRQHKSGKNLAKIIKKKKLNMLQTQTQILP